MTEFLRMSGIYWGVTALDLMDNVEKINQAEIIEFIKKCQCPFSGEFLFQNMMAIRIFIPTNETCALIIINCKSSSIPQDQNLMPKVMPV